MIEVAEAWQQIEQQADPLTTELRPLERARGYVLDEDVVSPIDSPPHDKSQVDGFAVRSMDFTAAREFYRVVEDITAGNVPTTELNEGEAARIMTGAALPRAADAVVMVERTEPVSAPTGHMDAVRIHESPRQGQNILRQGTAFHRGEGVLSRGHRIEPAEIGLLAELGVAQVRVVRRPTVAVISTGNELVPFDRQPGAGQIRNSNGPMLVALAESAGADGKPLGIARDTHDELAGKIQHGLESDVLLLSGGVSAGILDLVPGILRQLGVREVFHKVRLKPGKPLWFGTRDSSGRRCLVFGLPGNPVSSLVCFELFVRPALARLRGDLKPHPVADRAALTANFRHRGERATYFPGRLTVADEGLEVTPLDWRGSADLKTLTMADALICFPAGDYELPAETIVPVRRLRGH